MRSAQRPSIAGWVLSALAASERVTAWMATVSAPVSAIEKRPSSRVCRKASTSASKRVEVVAHRGDGGLVDEVGHHHEARARRTASPARRRAAGTGRRGPSTRSRRSRGGPPSARKVLELRCRAVTYRVIQWATGTVGIHAVPAIVAHPELELAGLWVHSDSKAGQDAGELCGGPPAGRARHAGRRRAARPRRRLPSATRPTPTCAPTA